VAGTTSRSTDAAGIIQGADASPEVTYGPNSGVAFGVPSSHGCLGLRAEDAAWLFGILGIGTPVDVHY
jgi:hypothetical protein